MLCLKILSEDGEDLMNSNKTYELYEPMINRKIAQMAISDSAAAAILKDAEKHEHFDLLKGYKTTYGVVVYQRLIKALTLPT
jgi:hypothetical protein